MATFTSAVNSKLHQGTYKVVSKIDWTVLLNRDFGHPDWNTLYPLNNKGQPVGLLTPRLACKVFNDALFIIKQAEEKPKYIQDLIPEIAHKNFKKKQWRKQFYEAMRRVACRLAAGKGIRPNCVAEDVFFHSILSVSFELGWRRLEVQLETLPECDKDKDFARLARMGGNEEIGNLMKGKEAAAGSKKTVGDSKAADVKGWFKCYELSEDHIFDHIVKVDEDETDSWSVNTGSTASSVGFRARGDSTISVDNTPQVVSSPTAIRKPRSNSGHSHHTDPFANIGLPMRKVKPRSDSVISAITTDDNETPRDAHVDVPVDLSSLAFKPTASA